MVRIERKRAEDGNGGAVMDLQVSETSDLPTLNQPIEGVTALKVLAGSMAQIIQASEPTFVTLDDDGTWYPEQS